MLRQIFEEAAAEQFSLDEDQNPVRTDAPTKLSEQDARPARPAAELAPPDPGSSDERFREALPPRPEAATELPGVSEEEYSRYRRQMNRRDI